MSHSQTSSFPHAQHKHMESLSLCLTVCSSCAEMCLNEGRKETAKICFDCADFCALTIKLHSRNSEFNSSIMELCAQICERCANECGKVNVEHCQQCSQVCKECADNCKKDS